MFSNRVNDISRLRGALGYMEQRNLQYGKIDQLCTERSKLCMPNGLLLFFYGIFLWIVFTLLGILLLDDFPSFFVWLIFIGYVFVVPIASYVMEKKKFLKKSVNIENELNYLNDSIKNHYLNYHNFPVSFDYSHPLILKSLINILGKGRAGDIKGAINCRIDDIHRVAVIKSKLEFERQTRESVEKFIGLAVLGILGIFWLGE